LTLRKTLGGELDSARSRPGTIPGRFVRSRTATRGLAALVIVSSAGCVSAQTVGPVHSPARPASASSSLVRVPAPDYASPASVAAAFYVAWASVDTIHEGPGATAARCAPLVTPQLERELIASQPATAAWAALRLYRTVVLIRVLAVTTPDGSPAPTSSRAYLRVYVERITVTTAGRTAAPDGVTVELSKVSRRWLVARILFF
jgi:hypothetical protein